MIRIAICDDNPPMLGFLSRLIQDILQKSGVEFAVDEYGDAEALAAAQEKNAYDVLFLDICMPKMSGFALAEKIRARAENAQIVFVTENEYLVYESMNYQPFYFIRKTAPEDMKSELEKTVKKLLGHMRQHRKMRFETTKSGTVVCTASSILFCEVNGHYLRYVTDTVGEFTVRSTIAQAEEFLAECAFLRIHKSYLVNMQRITAYNAGAKRMRVSGDVELPIGRAYENQVRVVYLQYLRGIS